MTKPQVAANQTSAQFSLNIDALDFSLAGWILAYKTDLGLQLSPSLTVLVESWSLARISC
jgi:hypothetical protein